MKKVTVNRNTWLRGEGSRQSFLRRRSDGRQCCLGFVCKQAGCNRESIEGYAEPREANFSGHLRGSPLVQALLASKNDDVIGAAMAVNDARIGAQYYIRERRQVAIDTDADRERILTDLLAPVGIELEFVN